MTSIIRYIISKIARKLYSSEFSELENKLLLANKTTFKQNIKYYEPYINVLISGEDHRFRYHIGFDIIAISRAIKNRIIHGRLEGASTIEQQLVRVLTNSFEITKKRKVKEIFLATTVSNVINKQRVPLIYLNEAYYGTEISGIDEIIEKLKVLNPSYTSIELAAEVVSRIKYPEPKILNVSRKKQIIKRKEHLVKLHNKHVNRKILKVYG